MLTPDRPPPEDYYQNNCQTLLEFVRAQYAGMQQAADVMRVADAYLAASDDAQRLFARLLTRKGPLFRVDSLNYAEVHDSAAAIGELRALDLLDINPPAPADRLLALLRKTELLHGWRWPAGARQWRKQALVTQLLSHSTDALIRQQTAARISWLQIRATAVWDLLRLLYFGERVQDWSAFVLRDLGMMQFEDIPLQHPRLADAAQLQQELRYRKLSQLSRRLEQESTMAARLADELVEDLRVEVSDRFLQRRRNKALLRIALWQERQGEHEAALLSYTHIPVHPARERRVRVLKKMHRSEECEVLLQQIQRAPLCEEEQHFVERFGRRHGAYQPPVTTLEITAVEASVELQALALLTAQGGWGGHVENSLLRSLTGLLYWDIIFLPLPGAFTNPFQSGPNDLYFDDFADARQAALTALESRLQDDAGLQQHLLSIYADKFGIANQLVNWAVLQDLHLPRLLEVIPAADIRRVCAFLIRNLPRRRSGMPDLFVAYPSGAYELVEVKGPNDQLQPGQRVWFEHLARLSIPSRIVKLALRKQTQPTAAVEQA